MSDDLLRLTVSLLVGALIGAEREYRNKSAGLRTIILICFGSTLFTILSFKIGGEKDPVRIAANIITGIGFLGAGAIFRDQNRVTGLTTATTIWVAAALGMGIGAGELMLSFIASLMVLVVLYAFIWLQNMIDKAHQIRQYKIVCDYNEETLHAYESMFRQYNLKAQRVNQHMANGDISGIWSIQGSVKNHEMLVNELLKDKAIKELEF